MRKLLFGGIAIAVMMATPALGADLPVKALPYKAVPIVEAPSWTGFYVGAELGANWSSSLMDYYLPCQHWYGLANHWNRYFFAKEL